MPEINHLLRRQIEEAHLDVGQLTHPGIQDLLILISERYDAYDEELRSINRDYENHLKGCKELIDQMKAHQARVIHTEKLAGIGQLSAGIAHEINNPLGFVQSNLDTLKNHMQSISTYYGISRELHNPTQQSTPKDMKECCGRLQTFAGDAHIDFIFDDLEDLLSETAEGLHRIEKIVRSLLRFTRKSYEVEYAGYDLNEGIKETLAIVSNEIKYHTKVESVLGNIPVIPALAGEINQVLLNLILNAGYAIKEKRAEGSICVRTYADSSYVYCEIADDGMGIPEPHLSRIFEPFYTTKPVGVGTGLGLSIAHDIIVNKHKGAIEVESEAGCGTTFKLKLPIVDDQGAALQIDTGG